MKIADKTFNKLSDPMKNYVYRYAWSRSGKIKGIHNEFGRCAFMCISEIPESYFLDREDKVEMVLPIQELFKRMDSI